LGFKQVQVISQVLGLSNQKFEDFVETPSNLIGQPDLFLKFN
jgi:hypothetical protein